MNMTNKAVLTGAVAAASLAALGSGYLVYQKFFHNQQTVIPSDSSQTEKDESSETSILTSESETLQEIINSSGHAEALSVSLVQSQENKVAKVNLESDEILWGKVLVQDKEQLDRLQIMVVVTPSYCMDKNEDIASRATLATWCLYGHCSRLNADALLNAWKMQGSRKSIYEAATPADLERVHGQLVKEGVTQILLYDECGQSSALAMGPACSDYITKLAANLKLLTQYRFE